MKPLLLLDIDGVLNPTYPDRTEFTDFTHVETPWSNFFLSPEQGELLRRLTKFVDIVWATSWVDYANEHISPFYGLPQLPVIYFTPEGAESLKIQNIIEYTVEHNKPFIWVDDEIEDTFYSNIQQKCGHEHFELITTNPDIGLTKKHVAQIYQFAQKHNTTDY